MFVIFISSQAQHYGDKNYYLVDSLDVDKLVPNEQKLLHTSLINFHKTNNQELKLQAINIIVENSWDDNVWHKYNKWVYDYTKVKLGSVLPLTNNQDLNSNEKSLLKFYANSLNNIGFIFNDDGDLSNALSYYYKSLSIREKIKDRSGISESYLNIGGIYDSQGNMERAIFFMKKALQFSVKGVNSQSITTVLNNLGVLHYKKGETDKALEYHNKALKIDKEYADEVTVANTLMYIARIHMNKGNLNKSLLFYKKSLKVVEENGYLSGQNSILSDLAEVYIIKGELLNAKKFAEKGLKIANKIGEPERIMLSSEVLSKIYIKTQNWKQASEMLSLYYTMRDSIKNNEVETSLIEQAGKYELDKKQQEIVLLSVKNEVQELRISKNRKSIFLISLALFSALILAYVAYRGYRKKLYINRLLERQKAEISRKNDDKKVMLQEIHHRVKNNLQVVNSLLRMQSSKSSDEEVIGAFKETQSRVLSMAKLHEKMYQSGDLKRLNAKTHITMLVEEIVKNYTVEKDIGLKFDIQELYIDAQTMMPLSLIINEIITNSLKYAFKGREDGVISVKLSPSNPVTNELYVSDNGIGFTPEELTTGLGSKLIQSFTRQLNGTIEKILINGTAYRLSFENNTVKR